MLTIISVAKEYSTDRVIDWLIHWGVDFKRINTDETIEASILSYDSQKQTQDETRYWFRKFSLPPFLSSPEPIKKLLIKEGNAYWDEMLFALSSNLPINRNTLEEPLNIKMLERARQLGLNIPHTLITGKRQELLNFIALHEHIIIKAFKDPKTYVADGVKITFNTSRVQLADVEKLPRYFLPVFAQQDLKKDYEVRVFHLDGNCYAIALFVQEKNNNSSDIREIKRRREVPCKVPEDIQTKIVAFMEDLGTKTGSFDFVVSQGKWYFIEINPGGQYDFVSKRGNYFLNKKIAKTLSS